MPDRQQHLSAPYRHRDEPVEFVLPPAFGEEWLRQDNKTEAAAGDTGVWEAEFLRVWWPIGTPQSWDRCPGR